MKYENDKVSGIKVAYIGGGSRGWAWSFMSDLAMEPSMSGEVALYDIDLEAAKHNEIIGNLVTAREDCVGKWNYKAVETLEESLHGADFVVISILPGTFEEMRSDVHTPEELGIYQSVGDTAGPGGMIRALRTLPMYVEIAEAIKAYAPKAWVINYTNPMSLCVKVLYKVFPEIKAFGCCHEVFGTQKVLAHICEEETGIKNIQRKDIHINVLGINHFTWFDQASYKGIDLFPIYTQFINKHYEEGFNEPDKNWANSCFECAHRVKFDLYKRYGLIAAAGDRHLAEFMPGDEYLNDPETVHSWKFGLTTVDWRINDLKDRLQKSADLVSGKQQVDLKASGEEGILMIKALVGLDRVISNVNLPNVGQVSNLPIGSVVETNAVFSKDSVKPIFSGALPEEIQALILPHTTNHDLILEAALTHNKHLVEQAFQNDPLTKAKCTDKTKISKLVNTMINNTLPYLPKDWKNELD